MSSVITRGVTLITTVNQSVPAPSAGFGTVTGHSSIMRRIGKLVTFKGAFTLGTTTNTQTFLTLPTGFVINAALLPTTGTPNVGRAQRFNNGSGVYATDIGQAIFYDNSSTTQVFFASVTGTGQYTKGNGTANWASNVLCDYEFTIPIV